MGDWTDIDLLVDFKAAETVTWTAPRWIQQGDILFFYHTKSAKQRIAKLRKAAGDNHDKRSGFRKHAKTIRLLEHAAKQAESYSGTIFGCARISGSARLLEPGDDRHFSSKSFAPLGQVRIFQYPLPAGKFADLIKVSQSATTRLHKPQFEVIKDLLGPENALPDFLRNATSAETEFPGINQHNWPHVACAENKRFIDEAHLRLNLIDYLLEELKDEGTPLLKECRCPTGGRSDYFLTLRTSLR